MTTPASLGTLLQRHGAAEARGAELRGLLERIGAVSGVAEGWPRCEACHGKISSHGEGSVCPGHLARAWLAAHPLKTEWDDGCRGECEPGKCAVCWPEGDGGTPTTETKGR